MSNLLMMGEIKAEVYQLSVYDASPLPLIPLSFFVTWSVTLAAWKMIFKKLRLPPFHVPPYPPFLPSSLSCRVT